MHDLWDFDLTSPYMDRLQDTGHALHTAKHRAPATGEEMSTRVDRRGLGNIMWKRGTAYPSSSEAAPRGVFIRAANEAVIQDPFVSTRTYAAVCGLAETEISIGHQEAKKSKEFE